MTYKGGELGERAGICMCVAGSLCCTTEGNTALSINYAQIKIKKKKIVKEETWRVED